MHYKYLLIILLIIANSNAVKQKQKFNPFASYLKSLQQEPPLNFEKSAIDTKDVKEYWLRQKLDHFNNRANNQTWRMRYLRNDKYFQPGSPIFIFVGGEWEITNGFLLSGHVHDIARQHNGMLYYTEHRYYGNSWPLNDTSVENLQYLTTQQALADLAYFIRTQKETADLKHSKVILTGGSYSASMVTWFTKLYANLTKACWASSAPLVAKLDFYDYMAQVGESIKLKGGDKCYKRIQNGAEGIANILRSNEANSLTQRLGICDNFEPTNELDVGAFFNNIGNYFAAIVQSYSSTIPDVCKKLMSMDTDDLEAFIKYMYTIFWPKRIDKTEWCTDLSYGGMKQVFTDINDKSSDTRQWFYQTCNEFGWYTTTTTIPRHITTSSTTKSSRVVPPFAPQVPLKYFQQLCYDVFGATYTLANMSHGISETNKNFGGLNGIAANNNDGGGSSSSNSSSASTSTTNAYENIFFTHGQLDPWRAVGLQNGKNVVIIKDYSHTADLSSINFNDSIEMNVTKLKIAAFIRRFLREG